jgi:hypothetical protein
MHKFRGQLWAEDISSEKSWSGMRRQFEGVAVDEKVHRMLGR